MTHTPASPVDRAIVRRRHDGIAPMRIDATRERIGVTRERIDAAPGRIDAASTRTDAIAVRASSDGPTAAPACTT